MARWNAWEWRFGMPGSANPRTVCVASRPSSTLTTPDDVQPRGRHRCSNA